LFTMLGVNKTVRIEAGLDTNRSKNLYLGDIK
jgi:hypothetical protein